MTVRVSRCPFPLIPPCRRYDVLSAGLDGAGGTAVGVEFAGSTFAYWRIIRLDGTLATSVEAQVVEVFGSGDDSLPCLIRSGTLRRGKGGLDRDQSLTGIAAHSLRLSGRSSCTKGVPFFQVPKQANPAAGGSGALRLFPKEGLSTPSAPPVSLSYL